METKKSNKADLEHRKPLFVKLGLVLALSCALFAFEWKQTEAEVAAVTIDTESWTYDLADVPPTKPEPVVKSEKTTSTSLLNLVPNDVKVDFIPEFGIDNEIVTPLAPVNMKEEDAIKDITDVEKVFVDNEAEFPGGAAEMKKFIAEKIVYPADERIMGMEGTLYLSFVVEKDGSVSNAKIVRSLNMNFDSEAIRVISQMPKWKPALDHGKLARQRFTIPIQFKLK